MNNLRNADPGSGIELLGAKSKIFHGKGALLSISEQCSCLHFHGARFVLTIGVECEIDAEN